MRGWIREKEHKAYQENVKEFINWFLAHSTGAQMDRTNLINWFEALHEKENLQIQLLTKSEVPSTALPGIWEGVEVQKNVDLTRKKYL